ncbi:MAG: hypothetical protein CGU29_04730 [Candidatus Dactylopiibacterium carminicum]|uniref:DUF2799 domain-containing protein n=2 Tax=Candidatus Dactylopiibacterium carminicum TaxID=857335 RepID=A0A272EW27_9RHOO|nr:DUF2799 domain-containing protein [Candidatus Dactylopiibacterium carminicum]PAS94317.1 MAG: hypothetical protein CGU29_04730 [Candidatus Dactylopiibacterium carminicum]
MARARLMPPSSVQRLPPVLSRHLPLLLLTTILCAACSVPGGPPCDDSDWEHMGFRDGQRGRSLEQPDTQCPIPLEADFARYLRGRERGLAYYCTAANGLAAGRSGKTYTEVCPATSERDFLHGYSLGQSILAARQRIDTLEQRRRHVEAQIDRRRSSPRDLQPQLEQLRLKLDMAWDELRRREAHAARRAPPGPGAQRM